MLMFNFSYFEILAAELLLEPKTLIHNSSLQAYLLKKQQSWELLPHLTNIVAHLTKLNQVLVKDSVTKG